MPRLEGSGRKPVYNAEEKALILSKAYPDAIIAERLGLETHRVRELRYDWNSGRAVGVQAVDLEDTEEL